MSDESKWPERFTLWRYVFLKTGDVTRDWTLGEPPAEAGPDGDGFELQVVESVPLQTIRERLAAKEERHMAKVHDPAFEVVRDWNLGAAAACRDLLAAFPPSKEEEA